MTVSDLGDDQWENLLSESALNQSYMLTHGKATQMCCTCYREGMAPLFCCMYRSICTAQLRYTAISGTKGTVLEIPGQLKPMVLQHWLVSAEKSH